MKRVKISWQSFLSAKGNIFFLYFPSFKIIYRINKIDCLILSSTAVCVCVLCLNSYFGFTKINQKVFVGKKWKAPTCPVPSVPISVLQPAMRTYKVRLSAVYSIATKKNNFAIIWLRIHPALLLNSPILQCFVCKYYTKGTDFIVYVYKIIKNPVLSSA